MEESEVIDIVNQTIWLVIELSAPIMLVGLLVGLVISLIQALTQIQEMTLSFVPKMLAIFIAIAVLFPHMTKALNSFTEQIADKIVSMG